MHLMKERWSGIHAVWIIAAMSPCAFGQTNGSRDLTRPTSGKTPARATRTGQVAAKPVVTTDRFDYQPGETVIITGSGFDALDSITLQVIHLSGGVDGGAGHEPWVVTSDETGGISSSWLVDLDDSVGSEFLLTADSSNGLHAETTFTDAIGAACLSSVTADAGGCAALTPDGPALTWDAEEGQTYTGTLTNVTDCPALGIAPDGSIDVLLLSASTGNICTRAYPIGGNAYTFQFELPAPACFSYPVQYCTSQNPLVCNANQNRYARQANCVVHQAVIRAALFDDTCTLQGPDEDCTERDCEVECPADVGADCNGSTDPSETGSAECSADCTPSYADSETEGACPQESTIVRTWTCTGPTGKTATCKQVITVLDITPPVVTCPTDCEIQCGHTDCSALLCDDADCQCGHDPTCTDDCGDCSIGSSCEFVAEGCPSVVAGVTPPPKLGTVVRTVTSTDGAAAVATGGCPNSASCTQRIKIVDTVAPEITCSSNVTVQNNAGQCCATVNFSTSATDSCDDTPTVDCTNPSGACFQVGTTNVQCTASDDCSNEIGCSFSITVKTSICGRKTYDANADGSSAGDPGIPGWKVILSGTASGTTYTDSSGRYCFNDLDPGAYTVWEISPSSNWVPTSPDSCSFPALTCPASCEFNNVCLGSGGGHTIGFWSNRNGKAAMNDGGTLSPELALLSSLSLRTALGGNFNPTTYNSFQTWLNNASATNMAYMLSAQLAAMALNVEAGYVSGSALVHAPGCGNLISVTNLMNAANIALGIDGYTPSGDANRVAQECLKSALDNANNEKAFVRSTACAFSQY